MKHEILIVTDDPFLLEAALFKLSGEPDLEIRGVSSLAEARAQLESSLPDLLATDLHLGDEDAVDLVREVEERGLGIPIIVTTTSRSPYLERLPGRRRLTILEEPLPVADLLPLIRDRLPAARRGDTVSGEQPSNPLQLADHVLLARLARRSVIFDIRLPGGETGSFEVVDGEIWSARFGERTGTNAVAGLLRADLDRISYRPLDVLPVARSVELGTDEMLIRFATAPDEEIGDQTRRAAATGRPSVLVKRPRAKEQVICARIAEDVEDFHASFILGVDDGVLLGVKPGDASGKTLGAIESALTLFAATQVEEGNPEWIEEMTLTSSGYRAHLRRYDRLVLGVLAAPSVRTGPLRQALRGAISSLIEAAADDVIAFETMPPQTTRRIDQLIDQDLLTDLNDLCGEILNGVPGSRCAGVLDSSGPTLVGLSHATAAEISDSLSLAGFNFSASSEKGFGEVRDLTLRTNRMHRYFRRVPDSTSVVALTTGLGAQRGPAAAALRGALTMLERLI